MESYTIPVIGAIGEQFKMTDLLMHINNSKNFQAIKLAIDSPGGDVDIAERMAELIVKTGKEVFSTNIGDVASAASRLFCIAPKQNRTFDAKKGVFVIHNPWAQVEGDASQMEMAAKQLKKTEKQYCDYYAARTDTSPEIIAGFMAENVPLSAEQIESLGFATIVNSELKVVAFINLNNTNKMDSKQISKFETILNRINSWLVVKALIKTDVNGNELDFPEVKAPEEILPGVNVMVAGTPAAGEYVMPDGSVYVCENGTLTEIVMPEPSEVDALKEQIATLTAEKETAIAAQASISKELTDLKAKAEADFNALNAEYVKIKAQFAPAKQMPNTPSVNNAGATSRKLINIK